MFEILTCNKISATGLAHFDKALFNISDNCENPDAIIVRSAALHEMEFAQNTIAIARAGAGVNNIPVDRCTEKGICVFNTPGANANAVKELVICALFLTSRKIVEGSIWCNTLGNDEGISKTVEKGKSNFAGCEILGKTLGVYGLGAIGIKVANAAAALGMKVIGYDPFASDATRAALCEDVAIVDDLNKIFTESDYITVHAPLTPDTKGIISKANLANAKDGIKVLNFARGELVAEDDMIEMLESGKVSAYATDFPTMKQIGVKGVVAIPHLGASSEEAEENCAVMAVNQLSDYIVNGNIRNSVNLPALSLEKTGKTRVAVIGKDFCKKCVSAKLEEAGLTVTGAADATSKKNGVVYVLADVDGDVTDETIEKVKELEGVIAIRII